MQLHWGWAVLGALAVGAALVWWTQNAGESREVVAHSADADRNAQSRGGSGPTLYRWVDSGGVVNITTDKPPAGRHYTIVHIDPNQNIVPMSVDASASTAH